MENNNFYESGNRENSENQASSDNLQGSENSSADNTAGGYADSIKSNMQNDSINDQSAKPETQQSRVENEAGTSDRQAADGCSYHYGQYSENGNPPVSEPAINQTSNYSSDPAFNGENFNQNDSNPSSNYSEANETNKENTSERQFSDQIPNDNSPKKPHRKINKGLTVFLSVALAVLLTVSGLSIGFIAGEKSSSDRNDSSKWEDITSGTTGNSKNGEKSDFSVDIEKGSNKSLTYGEVISKVSDSIVSITIYSSDGSAGGYASGIIMDAEKGYVLTNDHIYESIVNPSFLITLSTGDEFKATFVSGDSRNDIGILKIENPKNLKAAAFSNDAAKVGEEVLAIGMSAGLSGTVTEGIVSAVDRRVNSGASGGYSEKFIQTTAAINPGNSGGALVNMSGQVIGITSSKYVDSTVEGICFAIPTTRALKVIDQLQKNGKVVGRARLGITYTAINTVQSEINGLPTGLLIQSVDPKSDLYGKGYEKGCIITQINGKSITSDNEVLDIIDEAKAGDSVSLTIFNPTTKQHSSVTIKYIEAESTTNYTKDDNSNKSESAVSNFNFFGNQ